MPDKGRGRTSYLSSTTICDEFISIMSKRILNKIISDMKSIEYGCGFIEEFNRLRAAERDKFDHVLWRRMCRA